MIVLCENCNKSFEKKSSAIKRTKHNFCCRSCSATSNNRKRPKRKKVKKCKICSELILSHKQKCKKCIEASGIKKDKQIKDVIYNKHHKSSAYAFIRTRARAIAKQLGWNSCIKCGYNKHIEICHIKPIADFDESSLISEVNNINNIIPLCPNCHWEFDNTVDR